MDAIQRSGLSWTEENDLRWYFARDYESPLGLHSSLHGQIQQLKLGRGAGEGAQPTGEMHEATFNNARRLNRIAARLSHVPEELRRILHAAFGPMRPDGLDVWGELGPVVLFAPAAAEAYRRSRSKRPMLEWLQRLSHRVRAQTGGTRLRDAQLVAELRLDAEELLERAVQSYQRAAMRRCA